MLQELRSAESLVDAPFDVVSSGFAGAQVPADEAKGDEAKER